MTLPAPRVLACLTVALPAIVIVPLGGVDAGFQAALKLAALCVIVCSWAVAGRRSLDLTVTETLLASFVGGAVVSTAFSARLADGAAALGCAAALFLIARTARITLAGRGDVLEDAVLWAAAGTAGAAVLELAGLQLPWAEMRRPESTLGNRNQLAGYLTIMLPVLFGAVVRRRRFARPVTLVAVAIVVVTHCRGAYLSLAVAYASALVVVVVHRRRSSTSIDPRRAAVVLGILALGITLGALPWPGLDFGPSVLDSAGRVLEYDTGTGRERVLQHQLGLVTLGDDPTAWLLGFGAGSWENATSGHVHAIGEHAPKTVGGTLPNSDLLRILVEQGLLGLVSIGVVALLALRRAVTSHEPDLAPRAVLVASIVAACSLAAFDPQLVRPERVALLGVLLGVGEGARPRPFVTLPRAGVVALALAVGLSVVALLRLGSYAASSSIGVDAGARGLVRREERLVLAKHLFPRSSLDERRALMLALRDQCGAADEALRELSRSHPHYWGAHVELAQCFARAGRVADARQAWNAAVAVEPHVRQLLADDGPRRAAP